MKRIISLFAVCAFLLSGMLFAEEEKDISFFTNLDNNGVKFLTKMQTCSPAKYSETKETIHGKTKNGNCHYSYQMFKDGDLVENHCIIPMKVVLGYATTALDIIEYSEGYQDIASQRHEQNREIRKIMLDYCKIK